MDGYHIPVLRDEVVMWLAPAPCATFVDCTVGGGGHAEAILDRTGPDGRLIGIDRDMEALQAARERLDRFGGRVILIHSRFDGTGEVLRTLGVGPVDGVLADLGVSSWQLERAERGFSFSRPGPLEMRMDRTTGETAAEWLNRASEAELEDVITRYGEERWSRRIAKRIVAERRHSRVEETDQLARIVQGAIPHGAWPRDIHPATRTFQAIRIWVNEELDQIEPMIQQSVAALRTGGRLGIISFHSLEDRLVKMSFARLAGACLCPPGLPVCRCGAKAEVRILTKKPIVATVEAVRANPRARSAKLRVVEKLAA